MSPFLPENYKMPETVSKYLKFKSGPNAFRILGDSVAGFVDWKEDGEGKKPVRTPYTQPKPEPLGEQEVRAFWAFPVWCYTDNCVKILELTQVSIMNSLNALITDEAWGAPQNYDLIVTKTGEKMETRYQLMPKPPKELSPEIMGKWVGTKINLNALFTNDDPFKE